MADSGDGRKTNEGDTESDELKQLQEEEENLARKMEAEVSEELTSHIAKLESEMKDAFSQKLSEISQQCTNQVAEMTSNKQVGIFAQRLSTCMSDIVGRCCLTVACN